MSPEIMCDRVTYGHPGRFGQKNMKNLGFLLFVSYDLRVVKYLPSKQSIINCSFLYYFSILSAI